MKKPYVIQLSVEQLMARAQEITGIDLVDAEIVEPLTVLHRSYNHDAVLSEKGATFVQSHLLRILSNRLRMLRDIAAHPEILDEQITAPIVICGMARSGSTKMQKLLAASGDFNWMPFWQSLNPASRTGVPDEDSEPRVRDTDDFVAQWNGLAPDSRLMHEFATHEPEEEVFLMMHTLRSPVPGITQLDGYAQWLATQDAMRSQLLCLRDTLKYLQWQGLASGVKQWVLKSPHYYGYEQTIQDVFPGATLVATHRHPKETLPSLYSFLRSTTRVVSDENRFNYALFAGGAALQIGLQLENRRTRPDLRMVDIHYKELTESVASVAKKVYATAGVELTAASVQRMLDWEVGHPIHAKGAHQYRMEDFGLSEEKIESDFSPYIAFMKQTLGRA